MPQIDEAVFDDIARRLPPECLAEETSVVCHWLLYALARMVKPRHIAEIGTHKGDATAFLVRAVVHNGKGTVHGYELQPTLIAATVDKVKRACGADAPFQMHGPFDYGPNGAELETDFAFIDLDPKPAYMPVFQKLRIPQGGIVCAHDLTHPAHVGPLAEFARMLAATQEYEMILFPQERGMVVGRKA